MSHLMNDQDELLESEIRAIQAAMLSIQRDHKRQMSLTGASMADTEESEMPRIQVVRRATKIEWSLLLGLVMQAAALIWGAAKLTAGVDQLNRNMEAMSDYSVLRYRVEQHERDLIQLRSQINPPRR